MNHSMGAAFERRRGRGPGSNFELYSWLFMRVSGVVLLVIALFHLYWMHMVIGVENIDFMTIVERWQNPLWKLYDLFLLLFALTHGMSGARTVLDDYVHRPGWSVAAKSLMFVVYIAFLGMGAYIILTFAPGDWLNQGS